MGHLHPVEQFEGGNAVGVEMETRELGELNVEDVLEDGGLLVVP